MCVDCILVLPEGPTLFHYGQIHFYAVADKLSSRHRKPRMTQISREDHQTVQYHAIRFNESNNTLASLQCPLDPSAIESISVLLAIACAR